MSSFNATSGLAPTDYLTFENSAGDWDNTDEISYSFPTGQAVNIEFQLIPSQEYFTEKYRYKYLQLNNPPNNSHYVIKYDAARAGY